MLGRRAGLLRRPAASRERSASKVCAARRRGCCSASTSAGVGVAAREQVLDRGLEPVRHFAQAHRAGQAGAALERVQRAHAGRRAARRRRPARPVAHARRELRQQLLALFLEDREQLGVDRIDRVDVVVVVERVGARGRRLDLGRRQRGEAP